MKLTQFSFSKPSGRPFFFTSFVSSIDGKIIVKEKGYWPIGTKSDYEYFTFLRAHADAIVDAKNTALQFGKYTIRTIHHSQYQQFRKDLGKKGLPEYIVLTSSPNKRLAQVLRNDYEYKPTVLTLESAIVDKTILEICNIKKMKGSDPYGRISVKVLIGYLNSQGHKRVFIDGGPTFIAQLLQAKVLDEIHLTIAPKIFGSMPGKTLTMTEGILFPPDQVPQFRLISVEKIGDEVVLRYSLPSLADHAK